jgi:hypothetical protein
MPHLPERDFRGAWEFQGLGLQPSGRVVGSIRTFEQYPLVASLAYDCDARVLNSRIIARIGWQEIS